MVLVQEVRLKLQNVVCVELKKKEINSFYIFKNENKSMRIFNKLSNYLLKNKIDDLIDELILNNFTNKTILKYIREIPREIFVKKKVY